MSKTYDIYKDHVQDLGKWVKEECDLHKMYNPIIQWLIERDAQIAATLLLNFFTPQSCINIVTGNMKWVLSLFDIEILNVSGPYWSNDSNFIAIYKDGKEIERICTKIDYSREGVQA